jgi:hypothetical protein
MFVHDLEEHQFADLVKVYAVGATALWLRVIYSFRLTKILGPTIKMIGHMFADIGRFLILMLFVGLMFVCSANLFFNDLHEYSTTREASVTLFSSALGEFDF